MGKIIELPIIIGGEKIFPSSDREYYTIYYDSGVQVKIPKLMKKDIETIRKSNKYTLHDYHSQEIIAFFSKVGKFWMSENCMHPLYNQALEYLCYINGYDRKMAMRELNIISSTCSLQTGIHDLIDLELGDRFYLEEWVPRGDALVHVQPLGNVLNIMVGNVPVSGIMTILRGSITKNQTLAKLPKRDPITVLYFVLSMIEIDPNHPVSKSMNVFYWPGGDEIEDEMIDLADVICVWGGEKAVRSIRSKVKKNINIIELVPKISYAVVGKESATSQKVAIDLAHDIALYNQEACFSPQIAFVEGDYKTFIQLLAKGLELYKTLFPKGKELPDVHAHVSRTRLEGLYNQSEVMCTEDTEWTIIVIKDPSEINEHPLSRVIFIVPVENIKECIKYIDESIQTIAISPWDRNVEIRELATLKGAAKLTEIGLIEAMRNGSTHDNIYPIQHLVRWVSVERGCDYWGKYIEEGPLDTTKWLMMNAQQLENIDCKSLLNKKNPNVKHYK